MYFKGDSSGCIIAILIFLLGLYLLKELWWLFVGIAVIIIVAYWGKRIFLLLKESKETNSKQYNPQMGEVFKVCPYCGTKMKLTETFCPKCKRELT